MKVKAVILKKDHNNDIVVLGKKNRSGNVFHHDGRMYELDEHSFQVTFVKRFMFFKQYYITYYYPEGKARPLPLKAIQDAQGNIEAVEVSGEKCQIVEIGGKKYPVAFAVQPLPVIDIAKLPNLGGIPPEELEQIFNPYFLRTLAARDMTTTEKMMFMLLVGTACLAGYACYQIYNLTGNVDELKALLEGLRSAHGLTQPAAVEPVAN